MYFTYLNTLLFLHTFSLDTPRTLSKRNDIKLYLNIIQDQLTEVSINVKLLFLHVLNEASCTLSAWS